MHRRAVVHALAVGSLRRRARGLRLERCGVARRRPRRSVTSARCRAPWPAAPTVPPSTERSRTRRDAAGDDGARPCRTTSAPPTSAPVARTTARRPSGASSTATGSSCIGDSILASISDRYGDQLCDRAGAAGAGRSRSTPRSAGPSSSGARSSTSGWPTTGTPPSSCSATTTAATRRRSAAELRAAARRARAAARSLLLNVTRFEPEQDEVNYVLTGEANQRDDVRLLDWAARTAEGAPDADELLAGDGLHLSADGQQALAAMISRALGRAPGGIGGRVPALVVPRRLRRLDAAADAVADRGDAGDRRRSRRRAGRRSRRPAAAAVAGGPSPSRRPRTAGARRRRRRRGAAPPPDDDREPPADDRPPATTAPAAAPDPPAAPRA